MMRLVLYFLAVLAGLGVVLEEFRLLGRFAPGRTTRTSRDPENFELWQSTATQKPRVGASTMARSTRPIRLAKVPKNELRAETWGRFWRIRSALSAFCNRL